MSEEQMNILFMQIDSNTDNEIDWNDFSAFMLMRAEGKKSMREAATTQLYEAETFYHQIANPQASPHKDLIVRIQFLPVSKRYVTCSREG